MNEIERCEERDAELVDLEIMYIEKLQKIIQSKLENRAKLADLQKIDINSHNEDCTCIKCEEK